MNLQSVRGFRDVLAPDSERTAQFEALARKVLKLYGYAELRLPALEFQELFVKSTGETTDIVEKEMFLLEDSGGRKLALRPEGTPGAARAYLQHRLAQQGGRTKLFYIGGMFRAERPQAGRYREFEQIGAECFGNGHPAADREAIASLAQLFDEAGLAGKYAIHVNNLGCEKPECRPAYRAELLDFLRSVQDQLCEHCRARIGRNPLRALDCKGDGPRLKTLGQLPLLKTCAECDEHFSIVAAGPLKLLRDFSLVRGLDYYTRTVFEFKSGALGSQDALAGGGRYDGLVKSMGGPDTPAVGWALGVERTLLALQAPQAAPAETCVYVAVQTPAPKIVEEALRLLDGLRSSGRAADGGLYGHSLKSQLREADRLRARWTVIFGEAEFGRGGCMIKDMEAKDRQWEVPVAGALRELEARFKGPP